MRVQKMAHLIKFNSKTDQTLAVFKNKTIDACNSHTIIYSKNGFSLLRILDKMESIDIDPNRTRINYESGNYLLIKL